MNALSPGAPFKQALTVLAAKIRHFALLSEEYQKKDSEFESALTTLEALRTQITQATENGRQNENVHSSMALMKRLLLDAQVKLWGMAEDTIRSPELSTNEPSLEPPPSDQPEADNRMQLTVSQNEKGETIVTQDVNSNEPVDNDALGKEFDRRQGGEVKEASNEPIEANDRFQPTELHCDKKDLSDSSADGEVKIIRPPSPIPGPSCKPDFVVESEKISGNVATRLRLENERLKREVSELKKLVSASGMSIPPNINSEDEETKIQKLEQELAQAKEAITSLKADRKKLKAEKFDLLNQMKQLYATLEDKEKELRDFIRTFEQRMRDSEECLSQERAERERERWSLLKHARDEAERSLSLAAQLDIKQQELLDARRQLSSGCCLSDQESVSGGWRGVNGGPGDRTSGSVDSGLRGSSDRQSTANLSDSTTDGAPTITVEVTTNLELDSVSLVSSIATQHMYQSVTTPKECNSPSLSPLNAHSFSRSLDSSTLSRSVEQLSSPQLEVEPLRRGKLRGSGGSSAPPTSSSGRSGGNSGGTGSTWGSISRVFARTRHRKITSPSSQEDPNSEIYGRSWSPLTEEGYAEKLRLLREASTIPMERWRAPTVLAWLEIALGMPQYGPRCAQNIKSGKVLLELNDAELEVGLGIQHPMHRKKLRLAIEEHRHPSMVRYPCIGQLGHTWVSSEWLPDLGLAQYSENFATNLVDARMLDHLSKKELEKFLGVTRKFHQASIVHGIHLLRMLKYDRQALAVRRHQCETVDGDPLVWTNQRFIRWARNIDLGEYADNLKDSGVHGALVVLEPSLTGDTMATALGIPPSRNMIRRHLAAELEALVLPARTGFEQGIRGRRQGGSLGRSVGRIQSRALPLPPPPINEQATEKDRKASLRGSLSRAFGLKSRSSLDRTGYSSPVHEAVSPTSSESSVLINFGSQRPDSPQSAIVRRRPAHRHRRVKSIGDIDTITVTPV